MAKLTERPYVEWLEDFLQKLDSLDPPQILIAFKKQDGEYMTGYYNCNAFDKAHFAAEISADAMLGLALANADLIKQRAEEMEAENDG